MKALSPTAGNQTHFIGVVSPEDLSDTLSGCRQWMGDRFGCKSGFATPFHVTLIPPFGVSEQQDFEGLLKALTEVSSRASGFSAQVSGFGAFGDRTVFAHVEPDPRWNLLRDSVFSSVSAAVSGRLKKDARPFTPHVTVANRDIPPGAIPTALSYFATIPLELSFPVNEITLFEREREGWVIAAEWALRG